MFTVKRVNSIDAITAEELRNLMNDITREKLTHFYFKEDTDRDYRPEVCFAMAHDNKNIVLKFFVEEKYILAAAANDNEMVCRDSCVEFFVIPGEGLKNYYNFEFSCIGTCLLGSGPERQNRLAVDPAELEAIKRFSSLGNVPFAEKEGDFKWDLTVVIPISIFKEEALNSLSGKEFSANFYKCGDNLTKPHWISWNKQEIDHPDFHRPEFFEKIIFE